MWIDKRESKSMKKILTPLALLLMCISLPSYSACQIDKLEYCKADISTSQKPLTNSPKELKTLNNPYDNPLHKSQIRKEIQENTNFSKNSQPYNSNCQFGDCLNPDNKQYSP